jgi:hypothetical protein
MDRWESTPRLAFLSPEPGSGKTRALEVTEPLVPHPVAAVNVTPAYLFRKVGGDPRPTVLFDEIDSVFGPKARENEELRALLNAGHRKGAVAGRCVVRGRTIETEEIPAYCAVAVAGLGDLPETILTRSVVVRMSRRAPDEAIIPYRRREAETIASIYYEALVQWASVAADNVGRIWPILPAEVADRNADVWEPLIAVAEVLSDGWARRAALAAVEMTKVSTTSPVSLGVRLLADIRDVWPRTVEAIGSENLIRLLIEVPEAPWADLHGRELTPRGLSQRLRHYEISSSTVRVGEWVGRGYRRVDFIDAWRRYLPPMDIREPEALTLPADGVLALDDPETVDSPPPTLCPKCGEPLPQVGDTVGPCPHCDIEVF